MGSTAGIVVIGNEVLSGKVEEENARFLIRELYAMGIDLVRVTFIKDDIDTIASDVRDMAAKYTHVFTTGGVGSTHDDMTLTAIAQAFDVPIERNPTLHQMLVEHFAERMNDAVERMAMLPRGAELCGLEELRYPIVKMNNVYVFPGVPIFLRAKFGFLRKRLAETPFVLEQIFLSVSEDRFAQALTAIAASFDDVDFGSYPRFDTDEYKTKVTVEGRDPARVAAGREAFLAAVEADWIVRRE